MSYFARLKQAGDLALVVAVIAIDLIVWAGDRELRGGGQLWVGLIPVAAVVVYLTLLVRWTHPVGVFHLQWAFALAGLAVPGYEPVAGLLVALHAVARRTPRRTA